MSIILGLNAFHPDSSACLVIDGKLVGAVAEERLGDRRKHTMEFPANAIKWLLEDNGLRLRDVTDVAIARDASANLQAKAVHLMFNPDTAINAVSRFLGRQRGTVNRLDNLHEICDEDPAEVKFATHFVEHHMAHIASSYYLSPFEEVTAGWSYDGSGDFATALAARCEGTDIEVLDKVYVPNSLGHFYTAMCQFIGFDLFGEEYKVMGLAPYGRDIYEEEMSQIVKLKPSSWFELSQRFFTVGRALSEAELETDGQMKLGKIYSAGMEELFGPARQRGTAIGQREMDIARSTQVRFEQAAGKSIEKLSSLVPLDRMVMAGGCALNGVMNARVYRDFPVDSMYLQSASSDDGTALGAAYYVWHKVLGRTERFVMEHAFWGPSYSDVRLEKAVLPIGIKQV